MAYAQHNQCGCQKRLFSSWEDKRGKSHGACQKQFRNHACASAARRGGVLAARQLIIPFTYTINPSSLFKVHPTGKAHFGSFFLQSKVAGCTNGLPHQHLRMLRKQTASNRSKHACAVLLGWEKLSFLSSGFTQTELFCSLQINFPPRNCPHINVAKASPNLFLVENFHDTIYRRV